MTGENNFHCFDQLRTPLIITDKSGTVLYRNAALSSQLKKPYRGGNIFKYISGSDVKSFSDKLPGYAVIEYSTGAGINAIHHVWRSFVFEENLNTGDDDLLIWLFPRRISFLNAEQSRTLLPFYIDRLGTLRALFRRSFGSQLKNERSLPFSRSPESAYDSISCLSDSHQNSDIHETPTDLAYLLNSFGESASRQLGLRGFRFETYNKNIRVGDTLTNAGAELAALCAQLVYASLILSGGHFLIWSYSYNEKSLVLEFTAPYPEGHSAPQTSGSLYDAAYNNNKIALELFFCDLLWDEPNRRITWKSTQEQSVLRADYRLNNNKFIMLREDNRLAKKQIDEKINNLITLFGNQTDTI